MQDFCTIRFHSRSQTGCHDEYIERLGMCSGLWQVGLRRWFRMLRQFAFELFRGRPSRLAPDAESCDELFHLRLISRRASLLSVDRQLLQSSRRYRSDKHPPRRRDALVPSLIRRSFTTTKSKCISGAYFFMTSRCCCAV